MIVELAKRQGCTCTPGVMFTSSGVRVAHDADCPMVDAGLSALYRSDDGDVHDLAALIEVARHAGATVVAAKESVLIVPDGVDVAPTVPATCHATRLRDVTVYELRADVVADLVRQMRGGR